MRIGLAAGVIATALVLLALPQQANSYTKQYWINKQIRAATAIARSSARDPWPNCPDPGPRDRQGPGHSWYDTVRCENGGNWFDSPGFYRCGLQFHPNWERRFGRLCP